MGHIRSDHLKSLSIMYLPAGLLRRLLNILIYLFRAHLFSLRVPLLLVINLKSTMLWKISHG